MDYYTRDLKRSDIEDIHAYNALPEVSKYQAWEPQTYEETEAFVEMLLNRDENWMYNVIVDAEHDKVMLSATVDGKVTDNTANLND